MANKTARYDLALVAELVDGGIDCPAATWLDGGTAALDAFDLSNALSAIEAARRLGRVHRLQDARDTARDKLVRKAAAAALHKLRAAGVAVAEAPQQQWDLGEEQREVLSPTSFLGVPDEDGYVPFLFIAHTEHESVLFWGDAGPSQGHRQAEHGHLGRSKAKKAIRDTPKDPRMVEVGAHIALNLLQRAFDAAGNPPHEWDHLTRILPEGVVNSARLLDPLASEDSDFERDKLEPVDLILDGRFTTRVGVPREALGELYMDLRAALQSELEPSEASRERRVQDIVDKVANGTVEGASRATWAFALDALTVMLRANGQDEAATVARHHALGLAAGVSGADLPLMRHWADESIGFIRSLLSMDAGPGPGLVEGQLDGRRATD